MRAALWVLVFALITPLAARADDYGPKRDIAAIRHDLPVIEKHIYFWNNDVQSAIIESVVISNGEALAQLHDLTTQQRILSPLQYRYDRWWVRAAVFTQGDNGNITICPPAWAPVPELLIEKGVSPALATLAAEHLPIVQEAIATVAQWHTEHPHETCGSSSTRDPMYSPEVLPFKSTFRRVIAGGEYGVMVELALNDGGDLSEIVNIRGRAPTEAESWANPPSGNAYFFFSGTVQSAQPVHVQAGTTVEVWFPFVLDPSLRYSLTIAAPNAMSLGPVEGTLKDNTLHFVLPAFTAPPGAELMGEIDSD